MIVARKNWDENVAGLPYDERKDHKNDIWLENGTFAMCDGTEAYAQTIEAVIKTIRGEIQVDVEYGIPYFETIFATLRGQTIWAASVREAVKALDFVQNIVSFTYAYNPNTKYFDYDLTVKTNDSQRVSVSG